MVSRTVRSGSMRWSCGSEEPLSTRAMSSFTPMKIKIEHEGGVNLRSEVNGQYWPVPRGYPFKARLSGSKGESGMTVALWCSPRITTSSSVPGAPRSGRTMARARDLPTRQP